MCKTGSHEDHVRPRITVVIPTRDRVAMLRQTIDALRGGSFQEFELIVVDQSEDDTTRTMVMSYSDQRLRYVPNHRKDYGAASSRNLGIAVSRASLIAMTDDDTEPAVDWLDRVVSLFDNDDELDFIAGALVAPPFDPAVGFVPSFDADPTTSRRQLPLRAAGANLATRSSLLDRIGGFDEYCGPGSRLRASDDGDLLLRVVESGCKVRVDPSVRVLHTNGFRPYDQAQALHERYDFGNGGNYGRAARRGNATLGIWFLGYEVAKVARATLPGRNLRTQVSSARTRLKGFAAGFRLDPHSGFVSGEALQRLAAGIANASKAEQATSSTTR